MRDGLRVRAAGATDTGRVREHNEDSLVVGDRVLVVADGMGGHAGGEVASRIAAEAMTALEHSDPTGPRDVAEAVADANARILAAAAEDPGLRGMGTTLTGLVLVGPEGEESWVVLNVGDSRTYRLDGDRLRRQTVDHSEVQELVAAGLLDPEEVAGHPLGHVITRSLGLDPAPEADLWTLDPTAGERFVVCSDGLTDELSDADLLHVARRHPDTQQAASALVAAALEAGGRDNVTVLVVDVSADG